MRERNKRKSKKIKPAVVQKKRNKRKRYREKDAQEVEKKFGRKRKRRKLTNQSALRSANAQQIDKGEDIENDTENDMDKQM